MKRVYLLTIVDMSHTEHPYQTLFHSVYQDWKHKRISVSEAAERCKMARSTFYLKTRQYEKTTSTYMQIKMRSDDKVLYKFQF